MYRECRHILATGRKCKSPAVNGQLFCFFHFDSRRHAKDGLENRDEPLILPSLEDVAGIQIALMQVTNALASGRLTNKQAGLYLYSLQIASNLAIRAEKQLPVKDPVRSLSADDWGNIIGEEVTVCEPPHDCLSCTHRNTCDKFEDYEEEVEELEQQLAEQQRIDEAELEQEQQQKRGEDNKSESEEENEEEQKPEDEDQKSEAQESEDKEEDCEGTILREVQGRAIGPIDRTIRHNFGEVFGTRNSRSCDVQLTKTAARKKVVDRMDQWLLR